MSRSGYVTVEFYGIPRRRAGHSELAVAAGTVAEVLAAVECECPGLEGLIRAGRLAPEYLLSINGERFVEGSETVLTPGTKVLLLSADVGG